MTTKRCMRQDGLGGLGSVDPEGGVDLVSVLKDTRGLAKKGGHRKPNGGAGFVVWERPQQDTEKIPEGVPENSNASARGATRLFQRAWCGS